MKGELWTAKKQGFGISLALVIMKIVVFRCWGNGVDHPRMQNIYEYVSQGAPPPEDGRGPFPPLWVWVWVPPPPPVGVGVFGGGRTKMKSYVSTAPAPADRGPTCHHSLTETFKQRI